MPAVVRYIGMFRTAAVVYLFFGAVWIWRFAFTDYHPEQRPFGLALGVLALVVGAFLFRRSRFAIVLSAIGAGIVCLSATVFAPQAHGPGILFVAGLAIVTGLYTALAVRALSGNDDPPPPA